MTGDGIAGDGTRDGDDLGIATLAARLISASSNSFPFSRVGDSGGLFVDAAGLFGRGKVPTGVGKCRSEAVAPSKGRAAVVVTGGVGGGGGGGGGGERIFSRILGVSMGMVGSASVVKNLGTAWATPRFTSADFLRKNELGNMKGRGKSRKSQIKHT